MRALIMAGGRGSRMNTSSEKPMMEILGKKMIEIIIENLKKTDEIVDIYVSITKNTPKTKEYLRTYHSDITIIETKGISYHDDLKESIKTENLYFPLLVLPADMPLVQSEFLKQIIQVYRRTGKESLSIFIKTEKRRLHGSEMFELDGEKVVPSGINIIDGSFIDLKEIPQFNLLLEYHPRFINVNTEEDLILAQEYLKSQ